MISSQRYAILLSAILFISICTFTLAFETQNEQKLKKFDSHIKAISSRPRNATLWKLLANELHPGESFTSLELGGQVNRMYCYTKALEVQPSNSDNWVAMGFALLDPRQRMLSGTTTTLSAKIFGKRGKEIDAESCFIKAVESDGGRNARAWLGLSKVITPKEVAGAKITFPDGATSFTRLECLKKVLSFDSTSKETGSVAWFDLGVVLKRRAQSGLKGNTTLFNDPKFIVDPQYCFQRAVEIDFQNGEAWYQFADTLLSGNPLLKSQIMAASTEEEKQVLITNNASSPPMFEEKERVDARKMLMFALRFNAGLGDAWHLLAEIKQSYTQAEEEKRWKEKRREEEKERRAQAKKRKDEAKAILNEDFEEDPEEDAEDEEEERKRKEQEEYEMGSEAERNVLPFLDENSHHKVAGDEVWRYSRQECLQSALEAVRPTSRPHMAWWQLSFDLQERKLEQERKQQEQDASNGEEQQQQQQEKQQPEEPKVFVSGALMSEKTCLQASLVNKPNFELAMYSLCNLLRRTAPSEVLTIRGKPFSVEKPCQDLEFMTDLEGY